MNRYIITGTPGSGKTTLIRRLEQSAYAVVEEAATDVISLEQASGVLEPWLNIDFIDKVVALQKNRQLISDSNQQQVQFFDRSPICTYALCLLLDFKPTDNLISEIDRITRENVYKRKVFFIENLGFVEKTEARKISYEEALRFEELHLKSYDEFGYECIKIMPKSIDERANEILNFVKHY